MLTSPDATRSGSTTNGRTPRVTVVQDGARRHYTIPVALHQMGMLERVFTDWYAGPGHIESYLARVISWIKPQAGRRIAQRRAKKLDDVSVLSNPLLQLRCSASRRRFPTGEEFWEWESQRLGQWIVRRGFGSADAVYGYVRNVHPDVWKAAHQHGLATVGDQMIAPAVIERQELISQSQRWPGWEATASIEGLDVARRMEEQSWAALDHLTCGSQYVADGLQSQGVPAAKITVIPYAPSGSNLPFVDQSGSTGDRLTVGFVGHVNLRKGTPFFFEVARRLGSQRFRFVMVGSVALNPQIVAQHKGDVELIGPVPRSEILDWLRKFDVFFFPSTCEGCAGAVIEAMETGLPIVSTPNSGTVVRDGVEGFLSRYDDIDTFVDRLDRLARDRDLRLTMGQASRQRIAQMDMNWYCSQLADVFQRVVPLARYSGRGQG
jgi:glycosyltransferase involved in cell wall biosynthesis